METPTREEVMGLRGLEYWETNMSYRLLASLCMTAAAALAAFGVVRYAIASTDECQRLVTGVYAHSVWTDFIDENMCAITQCDQDEECQEDFIIGLPNIYYCACAGSGHEAACNIQIQGSQVSCRNTGCAKPCSFPAPPAQGSGQMSVTCSCPP